MKTITYHAEIVLRAAAHWANGSPNAIEIAESIAFVRAYISDQDEKEQEPELLPVK